MIEFLRCLIIDACYRCGDEKIMHLHFALPYEIVVWPLASLDHVEMLLVSLNTWLCCLVMWRKEGWKLGLISIQIEMYLLCCKFFTLGNTNRTLAKFFKIPTLSLFRVPIFLA